VTPGYALVDRGSAADYERLGALSIRAIARWASLKRYTGLEPDRPEHIAKPMRRDEVE
jgi:hypothetical protein